MKSTVAISAASSFTGMWIARELARQSWNVYALFSQPLDSYSGLREQRVRLVQKEPKISCHFNIRAEDGSMVDWIKRHAPTIWIHHHHFMEDFRLQTYDYQKSMEIGLEPLPSLTRALGESGCRGIIYSGTYFEPGLGGRNPSEPITPYGRSKAVVWERLQTFAQEQGIKISKVVIPNPIGPFENEDRLIPLLIRHAKERKPFLLKTPQTIGDHIPWDSLAKVYVELAEDLLEGKQKISSPSGWVTTNLEFANQVNQKLISKGLQMEPCRVQLPEENLEVAKTKIEFRNPIQESIAIDWNQVWDDYAECLTKLCFKIRENQH